MNYYTNRYEARISTKNYDSLTAMIDKLRDLSKANVILKLGPDGSGHTKKIKKNNFITDKSERNSSPKDIV